MPDIGNQFMHNSSGAVWTVVDVDHGLITMTCGGSRTIIPLSNLQRNYRRV